MACQGYRYSWVGVWVQLKIPRGYPCISRIQTKDVKQAETAHITTKPLSQLTVTQLGLFVTIGRSHIQIG
jgi:hypothetical protein